MGVSRSRITRREPTQATVHFGLKVRSGHRHGLRIDRDTYAQIDKHPSRHLKRETVAPELWDAVADIYEDDAHRIYTDAWCIEHRERALQNFDRNMAHFASLDHAEFNQALGEAVAAQRGMVPVDDLNLWAGKAGLYLMVLDHHCQAYVGVTESKGGIQSRIRQHWTQRQPFDSLMFGSVDESIMAIDSFRALDTTRIFAAKVGNPQRLEDALIASIPAKFLLNRVRGGGGNLLGFASLAGAEIIRGRELPELPRCKPKQLANSAATHTEPCRPAAGQG